MGFRAQGLWQEAALGWGHEQHETKTSDFPYFWRMTASGSGIFGCVDRDRNIGSLWDPHDRAIELDLQHGVVADFHILLEPIDFRTGVFALDPLGFFFPLVALAALRWGPLRVQPVFLSRVKLEHFEFVLGPEIFHDFGLGTRAPDKVCGDLKSFDRLRNGRFSQSF